jgi:hypothetical protein
MAGSLCKPSAMTLQGDRPPYLAHDRIAPVATTTFAGHLMLFAVCAAALWASAFGLIVVVVLLCLAALAVTGLRGAALALRQSTRRHGAGLLIGSALAGGAQVALLLVLLVVYSNANPGWDLS